MVGGLHERMVDHDRIALYVRIYNEERQALAADSATAHRRAAQGIERVDVRICPRVAVISTADELRQPGQGRRSDEFTMLGLARRRRRSDTSDTGTVRL